MKKEILPDGLIRLTSKNGLIDTRTNRWHSVVECSEKSVKYFIPA